MVYSGMIGIAELMTDDNFMCWMEHQTEEALESLSTYEVYSLYCREMDKILN